MVTDDDRWKMNFNLGYWNEVVSVHARSDFYKVAEFLAGGNTLDALERGEVGDVSGKSLLHLQCHFGLGTLSWARLGAQVTGMDYSIEAIRKARELAGESGLQAEFVCCNLYDLPQHLKGQFDIVFTSYGVLGWLPDLREWARIAASYVKPGGIFYIAEFHPFAFVFDDESDHLRYRYPYFGKGAVRYEFEGTYADRGALLQHHEDYEWNYTLGEIVSSLIDAGLVIEFLHEHPFTVFEQLPFLEKTEDGVWRFPGGTEPVPLMFSLRAHKVK